ncbi:MAG: hypothetical protein IEMM0008_1796 [bacterium]|nr:MAG: hypothetical protein IEMM0008_1796 [bacterium]
MSQPGFWDNREKANTLTTELSQLKRSLKTWKVLKKDVSDLQELVDLAAMEQDESMSAEIESGVSDLEEQFKDSEFRLMLNDPADRNSAFLTINAGAGGTEACDWASMLQRMYTRWAEDKKFKIELVDYLPGDEAGIKNLTLSIKGEHAYGFLKSESGVHRLVRISPFDSNKRRHTSFASVYVFPEVQDDIDIEINPSDLRIDT